MTNKKLSRNDWVDAGFDALRNGGPQAVKVESIAKALKISRGSFYWHFRDASDLKSAMLNHWVALATTAVIKEVGRDLKAMDQTLHALVRISAANLNNPSRRAAMNESAIRDWARYDSEVAKVMKTVDKKRLNYVTEGFNRAGFAPKVSKEKAKTLYAALIGLQYLARHNLATLDKDLPQVLTTLLETKSG